MNTDQFTVRYCQSCSMPMERPEEFGTERDGSRNNEYCNYCYQNGKFTEPEITMDQMIEKCAGYMSQMHMPEPEIEQVRHYIPLLKRWNGAV